MAHYILLNPEVSFSRLSIQWLDIIPSLCDNADSEMMDNFIAERLSIDNLLIINFSAKVNRKALT